jgi:hypothetical protein
MQFAPPESARMRGNLSWEWVLDHVFTQSIFPRKATLELEDAARTRTWRFMHSLVTNVGDCL